MPNLLHVRSEEWDIAQMIFKHHPEMRKLPRKDIELWKKFAFLYFSEKTMSTPDLLISLKTQESFNAFNQKLAQAFVSGSKEESPYFSKPPANSKYEQWLSGLHEPRLHSFERIGHTIYASAVHSYLGLGREASVKLLESKSGHRLAKRCCKQNVPSADEIHPFSNLIDSELKIAYQLGRHYDAYETAPKPVLFLGQTKYFVKARTFHPYYAGGTLESLIVKLNKDPAFSREAQLTLALKVIECVYNDAFKHGLVHLDIKPANIMIEPIEGTSLKNMSVLDYISTINCRLIDLSNAIQFESKDEVIDLHNFYITKGYQPPESAHRKAHRNSDLFSTYKTLEKFMPAAQLSEVELLGAEVPKCRISLKDAATIIRKQIDKQAMPHPDSRTAYSF